MRRFALPLLLATTLLLPLSASPADDVESLGLSPIHLDRSPRAGMSALGAMQGSFPDAQPVYHNGDELYCTDCHIMHASQQHEYEPGHPQNPLGVPYSEAPNGVLLHYPDPLDLCLSCHDGHTFAPDVLGVDSNALTDRSAGFFGEPEVINPSGHDLGRNLPSGGGFGLCMRCHFGSPDDAKVTCIDCHDPHGNHVARNLRWASDPAGTPELGLFTNPSASGMSRYEAANVSYGTLNSTTLREVTNMCLDCHHTFSGGSYIDPEGDGIHELHPTYDSERGSTNSISQGAGDGGSNPVHWEGGTGSGFLSTPRLRFVVSGATDYNSALAVDADFNGVFCLSCHKAHGSDQAFSVDWQLNGGYGAPGCDQCHYVAQVDSP